MGDFPNNNGHSSIFPEAILDIMCEEPNGNNKSIVDPSENVDKENPGRNKSPLYAHKSHLYWRRRRMRRHRLIRWRKKHHRIVREREARKLSKDEADAYIKEWKESGLLVDIL